MYIIHGDNTTLSRDTRQKYVAEAKAKNDDIRVLDGTSLTLADLESATQTANLFGGETLVIDGLLSRLKSKEKELCQKYLAETKINKNLILWEKKELTPTVLKPFLALKATIVACKQSRAIFPFLDNLYPGNQAKLLSSFHLALVQNPAELLFGSMVKRLGDLLIARTSPTLLTGAPWQLGAVKAQASKWTESDLRQLHASLLDIDLAVKTGRTKLDLASHLDLLFMTI